MRDQRVYLKVKIKSLAEEAKIIRAEEKKPYETDECGYNAKQVGLYTHRTGVVRRESRHTLLAYGFIRGLSYRQMEATCHTEPNWDAVWRMISKYGPQEDGLRERFDIWRKA